jgi:hypothetical protein
MNHALKALIERLGWKPGDVQVVEPRCTCIAFDDFESGIGGIDRRGCPVHGEEPESR